MWYYRRLDKSRSPLFLTLFLLAAGILLAACGRTEVVEPTVAPTASPVAVAVVSTPVPVAPQIMTLPSVADLVEEVSPSVVSISVESVTRGLFFNFTDEGVGTGIVIRSDGFILTNLHVVQNARDIKVHLPNGDTYDARVVGEDALMDLAIVEIDAEDLPAVTFGDSKKVRVGDWVVVLGNALALKGGPTVTLGIVSALGRTITTQRGDDLYDLIQTDAAINEGNSGGPVVNLDGEVVGISTVILADARGIGFAVSSSVVSSLIDTLIENGRVVRPLIGLAGMDVTPAIASQLDLSVKHGVIVTRMTREGPAYLAGIRVGDVITKIDDIPTADMGRFLLLLWSYEVGDTILVEYVSDEETSVTPVELKEERSGTRRSPSAPGSPLIEVREDGPAMAIPSRPPA